MASSSSSASSSDNSPTTSSTRGSPVPALLVSAFWERGSPDLPARGPRQGFASRHVWPIFINKAFKTLVRGQASRGRQRRTSSGAASLGWLVRGREIKARRTSRGSNDASHDDRDQAGASAHNVLGTSLVLGRQAQMMSTEASGKRFPYRCNETKTSRTARRRSPWSPRRRHHQSLLQANTTFCQDKIGRAHV